MMSCKDTVCDVLYKTIVHLREMFVDHGHVLVDALEGEIPDEIGKDGHEISRFFLGKQFHRSRIDAIKLVGPAKACLQSSVSE